MRSSPYSGRSAAAAAPERLRPVREQTHLDPHTTTAPHPPVPRPFDPTRPDPHPPHPHPPFTRPHYPTPPQHPQHFPPQYPTPLPDPTPAPVPIIMTPSCTEASSSRMPLADGGETMDTIAEKLSMTWVKASKLIKMTEKLQTVAEAVPPDDRTRKYTGALADLMEAMEQLETQHSDLGFLLKYKKTRGGTVAGPMVRRSPTPND